MPNPPASSPAASLLIEDLRALVSVESPSRHRAELDRSARLIADLLAQRTGVEAEIVASDAGAHVHWRAPGEPRLLVLGHHDTVFPLGTLDQRPFAVSDGRATGPGVFDMKGGIAMAIHALAALCRQGRAGGIELLLTSDEEVGSGSSRALLEARAEACGAVLVLEPAAPGGAVKTGRKGNGTFRVTATGRAAHAGLEPERGANALIAAAEIVAAAARLGDPGAGTTVTPTMASAGTAENTVPDLATVVVDARVTNDAERQRVEAAMRALPSAVTVAGVTVTVTGSVNRPPMPESSSVTLFPAARAVAARLGHPQLDGVMVGGASDGNFTAARGVPTLDGLGAIGDGAHSADEYVVVDALVARTELLIELFAEIASRPG